MSLLGLSHGYGRGYLGKVFLLRICECVRESIPECVVLCTPLCRREVSECKGKETAPLFPGGWSESQLLTSNTREGDPYVLSPHTTEGFCSKGPQGLFPAQGRGEGLRTSMWTVRGRGRANSWTDRRSEGRGFSLPKGRAQEDRDGRGHSPNPRSSKVGKGKKQKGKSGRLFQDQGQGLSPLGACVGSRNLSVTLRLNTDPNVKPSLTWSQMEPQS